MRIKYWSLPFLLLVLFSCGNGKEIQTTTASNSESWSFTEIANWIKEGFPESYDNFVTISFQIVEGRINPAKASFLIPSRFFEKELDQKIMESRTDDLMQKMGDPGSCHQIKIGESKEYAWHS
jgi:hypothetical protein